MPIYALCLNKKIVTGNTGQKVVSRSGAGSAFKGICNNKIDKLESNIVAHFLSVFTLVLRRIERSIIILHLQMRLLGVGDIFFYQYFAPAGALIKVKWHLDIGWRRISKR